MTDAELSRELALALGYYPESVRSVPGACFVLRYDNGFHEDAWVQLDYRDADVCLPLIKWLMEAHRCEPGYIDTKGKWYLFAPWGQFMSTETYANTLEEAVCKAVIAVKGKP